MERSDCSLICTIIVDLLSSHNLIYAKDQELCFSLLKLSHTGKAFSSVNLKDKTILFKA